MGSATAFASSSVSYVSGTADSLGTNSSNSGTGIFGAYVVRYGQRVFGEEQQQHEQRKFIAGEDDIKLFDAALFSTFEFVAEID
jgi:hypothetical protein